MMRLVAALIVCLAAAAPVFAAEPPDSAALVKGAGFAPEDVGYLVVDLKDNKVLAAHNPDGLFIPASVAKVPALAAALDILGGDHRFSTDLLAAGDIKDGVLSGPLVLRGGGDPFLSGDDLQVMARDLAAAGITTVDGPFLYDATALVEIPQINPMQPEAAGYNTGVSALSVNFNRVRLFWRRDGADPSAAARAISENVALPLDAIGLAFAAEEPVGPVIRATTASEDSWLLSPKLSNKGEDWLPVGNPSLITAEVFRGLAAAQGIDLSEPTPGATPDGAKELVSHESIPLASIAKAVLRYSNNLSAELIGLAASRRMTGRALPLDGSAGALSAWWKFRIPGADWAGMDIRNHSGLSSDTRVTPRQLVAMLEAAAERPVGGADFHDLLREIGWKGVKGSARVKTGTMSYARGLAGYVDTAAGSRLAFAIFVNDKEKRADLDAAFDPRINAIDPDSRPWRNRARRLEQELTTDWAERY